MKHDADQETTPAFCENATLERLSLQLDALTARHYISSSVFLRFG